MECSEVLFLFTERIWQCFTIQLFQWLVPVTLIKNIIVINISSQILVADNEDSRLTNTYKFLINWTRHLKSYQTLDFIKKIS